MATHPHISIVSPVYRGEKMVHELVERIVKSVSIITEDFEIILVNDASPDASWLAIQKECAADERVKGIDLSRNFGQHYAITAGLTYAKGDWVVVMDCDLQDRPEEIPNLYAKAQEGWDIVRAHRTNRTDKGWKRLSGKIFHAVFDWMSGVKTDRDLANFGIYNQRVIAAYNSVGEYNRAFGSIIRYLGFRTIVLNVQHAERAEGKSSYTLAKLLKLSFDVVIAHSNKPLRMAVGLGFMMSMISIIIAVYNVIARLTGIIALAGFTTTVFSIWFVGGLILFVMGILGLYIGKIFDQVKGRPNFVVREEINVEKSL